MGGQLVDGGTSVPMHDIYRSVELSVCQHSPTGPIQSLECSRVHSCGIHVALQRLLSTNRSYFEPGERQPARKSGLSWDAFHHRKRTDLDRVTKEYSSSGRLIIASRLHLIALRVQHADHS